MNTKFVTSIDLLPDVFETFSYSLHVNLILELKTKQNTQLKCISKYLFAKSFGSITLRFVFTQEGCDI